MFKKSLIATFMAGTLSISGGALAADWSGFNVGLQAASGDGTTHFNDGGGDSAGIGYDGLLFGVSGGYAWQFSQFVVGAELDFALGDLSGSGDGGDWWGCGTTDTCTATVDKVATLRARIGYDMGNFLPYLTAGWARGDTTGELSTCDVYPTWCGSETRSGAVYGLGGEYAFTDTFSARAEYLRVDLGTSTYTEYKAEFEFDVIRASINYNF